MQPVLPNELIGLILSKLGPAELLNCRLICRSWNAESLIQLRNSGFRKKLTESNIRACTEFLSLSTPEFIVPFSLGFRLRVTQLPQGSSFDHQPLADQLLTLTQDLDELFNVVSPDLLYDLALVCPSCPTRDVLLSIAKLLAKLSPHLRKLELVLGRVSGEMSQAAKIWNDHSMTFPHLKVLIFNRRWRIVQSGHEDLYCALIQKCQTSLSEFGTSCISSSPAWHINLAPALENLVTLRIGHICRSSQFLKSIRAARSAIPLQNLKLMLDRYECRGAAGQSCSAADILIAFSTTLKTLKIMRCRADIFDFEFPTLPLLERGRLEIIDTRIPYYVNVDERNICQSTFPSLKSIDLPIGLLFRGVGAPIFPTVQELTMRVTLTPVDVDLYLKNDSTLADSTKIADTTRQYPPGFLSENIRFLQHAFPNLNRVCIVNALEQFDVDCQPEGFKMRSVVKEFIQSGLVGAIETFEVRNYDQDYLGQILKAEDEAPNGSRNVVHRMTNLKTLRLELSNKRLNNAGTRLIQRLKNQPLPDLERVAQHFPTLGQVTLSGILFGWEIDRRSRQICAACANFPNWRINVI